ncbi:MAG: pseudouridine synthase [Solirubrobacteraceae bacterium]
MRLAKFLAHAGVASRRAADGLIGEGRVTVNGAPATDPARDVVAGTDEVTVDGVAVALESTRVVYVLNKPAGVVSTAQDTHGRPTVVSLVPSAVRLYPVGRLDIDTTGLLLLTNDGELAHHLTHPRFEVQKTYRAVLARPPISQRAVRSLRDGVQLEDGLTAAARVRRLAPDTLEITIHEGRNRQIKRMCEAVGHRVRSLQRVAFGPLRLGELAPGRFRRLQPAELDALTRLSAAAEDRPARGGSSAARGTPRARSAATGGRRRASGS